ncbi:MAG: TauD/TfdA family dioxygenase [Pseudomonadota bacterium]|nr:TauD/TfdA family dioxygenase [Pseudomonadota bacterium]
MATQVSQQNRIMVTPIHPVIGAEVTGVDLSQELDELTIRLIREAWYDYGILLFRDQNITGDEQLRFASNFGPIAERHKPKPGANMEQVGEAPDWVNLMMVTDKKDEDGKPVGGLGHGEMWFHSDKCYHERPHRASFLYGIEIPREGGHTKFSSLYGAYNNMRDDLKVRLADARIMQGYDYRNVERLDLNIDLDNIFHFSQPLIVTNPGSKRKALYVSRLNSMWIEEIDREESEEILSELFELTEDPNNYYEHVWKPGDLMMWDNLACLHARTDWPEDQTRMLRRCTTIGEPLG